MTAPYRIEAFGPAHDATAFACGVAALDAYLRTQASQDVRRRASACYVALDNLVRPTPGKPQVAAYYTLAAAGVALTELPAALAKRLPRYPSVPVARVGRLAVELACQGHRLGAALLADAVLRTLRSKVAIFALVVDAKDVAAERFYAHHGFERYGVQPRQLILPLARFKGKT